VIEIILSSTLTGIGFRDADWDDFADFRSSCSHFLRS
jgi:hypothetical protein